MARLINTVTMTTDGVTDVGEWYVAEGGHSHASREQFVDAGGLLLGRKTYDGLAAFWPGQTGIWADTLNPLQKFVASHSLRGQLEWNASVLEGDAKEGVAELKQRLEADLIMSGNGELAADLITEGLVDEIRFWVHPVVWGEGTRPFEDRTVGLRLLDVEPFDSGVVLLRYEP